MRRYKHRSSRVPAGGLGDLAQWQPVIDWLRPALVPAPVAEVKREPVLPTRRVPVLGARPLHPAQGVRPA